MTDAALDVLASLVLEDGRRWGDAAHGFQWEDARHVLTGPERLAYLTRPRGASKTTDLAGIAVAALLAQLPAASRSYAVAADRDQGALLTEAAAGFVARTPELAGAVRVDGYRMTAAKSAASLTVLAADADSAFGLRPHLLIVDERAQWATTQGPERLWSALFSALPKVPGSRLVVLTSAGDPAHPAHRLLVRARRSPGWYVSETRGPCPWLSKSDLDEQRQGLTDAEFSRYHLNVWAEPDDRLAVAADLAACVTLDGALDYEPGCSPYVIGLDVGLKRDRTVAAVMHLVRVDGRRRVVLDRLGVWQGSPREPVQLSEVEGWLRQASRHYRGARVVGDPWQAVGLLQRLRAGRVPASEFVFTSQSVGRLAKTLYDLIRDHDLALPPDELLLGELGRVRLREPQPGVFRLDHDPGAHDDRAVAIGLAAQDLLGRASAGSSAPRPLGPALSAGLGERFF